MTDKMKDIKDIDFKEMKTYIKEINDMDKVREELGMEKIKIVAVKKEVILANFSLAVEKICRNKKEEQLSDDLVNFFNDLFLDDETEDPEKVKAEAEKEIEKAEKKAKRKHKRS